IRNWQVTSMSCSFINEVNYLTAGGVYPTRFGVFGIGFVGSNLSFSAPAATFESVGDDIRYVASSTESISNAYANDVLLLSYSVPLREYLLGGVNFKVFSQKLAGSGITGGDAMGYDMDIGFQYKPKGPINAALVFQNIVPFDMGGKLSWATGTEEDIPAIIKTGLSLKLLGEDAFASLGDQQVRLNVDSEVSPTGTNYPALFHLGMEWSPLYNIDLRMGLDQDVGDQLQAVNNFTAGIGLYYAGCRFDYAYHQYHNIPEFDTHYFSVAYGIWKEAPAEKEYLNIISPKDKSIQHSSSLPVYGQVLDQSVKNVWLQGKTVKVDNSMFESEVGLRPGKNTIIARAVLGSRMAGEKRVRVLFLKAFRDIEPIYWAKEAIEKMATLQMIDGYPDNNFRPYRSISRAEYITLLVKILGVPVGPVMQPPFKDVPINHWAAPYIARAAELGLSSGYTDGTFKPFSSITRAEGVVMAVRFGGLEKLVAEAKERAESPFPDIDPGYWAANEIAAAKAAGYLEHLKGKPFTPQSELSRGETAGILSNSMVVRQDIEELMDWNTGY
ncbi:MAG: S-layer homology domain-containing protein, partial [Candidatus Margulisbacteria bacterium]|nr:S-layer homology domain-containing protein [Candidatus Margulisiibacteriota bacterium]